MMQNEVSNTSDLKVNTYNTLNKFDWAYDCNTGCWRLSKSYTLCFDGQNGQIEGLGCLSERLVTYLWVLLYIFDYMVYSCNFWKKLGGIVMFVDDLFTL
jgi:hypothetical protein